MKQRRLNGWLRLALTPALLLLVLAASLVSTGRAHAQSDTFTITIASSAQLIARTTLQISGTASCTLPEGATLVGSPGGSVEITQASGRQIVQATSNFFLLTACDGTTQPFQVFATPPAGSAPFHGGSAIATGTYSVTWIDASGYYQEVYGSTNPEAISISG